MVTTNPHGRYVDTHMHEAPSPMWDEPIATPEQAESAALYALLSLIGAVASVCAVLLIAAAIHLF